MSDQALIAAGIPLSEAYPMRRDMEKEIALGRMNIDDFQKMTRHICTCGGHCENCHKRKGAEKCTE